jgi:hypothetical protein
MEYTSTGRYTFEKVWEIDWKKSLSIVKGKIALF